MTLYQRVININHMSISHPFGVIAAWKLFSYLLSFSTKSTGQPPHPFLPRFDLFFIIKSSLYYVREKDPTKSEI